MIHIFEPLVLHGNTLYFSFELINYVSTLKVSMHGEQEYIKTTRSLKTNGGVTRQLTVIISDFGSGMDIQTSPIAELGGVGQDKITLPFISKTEIL